MSTLDRIVTCSSVWEVVVPSSDLLNKGCKSLTEAIAQAKNGSNLHCTSHCTLEEGPYLQKSSEVL